MAQSRAHSTVQFYLAALCHLHILQGFGNHLSQALKLDLVLRGIQRIKPRTTCPRLSITPQLLLAIRGGLEAQNKYDAIILWEARCTALFGFMHCAELTSPSPTTYDKRRHLLASDISVDSHHDPSTVAIWVKASKPDQFLGRE